MDPKDKPINAYNHKFTLLLQFVHNCLEKSMVFINNFS